MTHTPFRLLIATSFMIAACTSLHARQFQAKLSHYSTDDGLASNAIAKMRQDGWGFLWLGTWNGLSRFDGYDFYNYRTGAASHVPNLHNRIYDIAIDAQQNVWMHMYDNRIFVLRRETDRIVNPFDGISGNEDFRTDGTVFAMSGGDVLVPIAGKGLYKMRVEHGGVDCRLVTTGGLRVTAAAEGYQDDIWLGTDQGIHRLDASNMTIEKKGMFLDEQVTCLFSNGYSIFAGTQSGKIVCFAYGQEPQTIRTGGDAVETVFVDSHGLVWFSDTNVGALMLNPATGTEKRFTQTLNTISYEGGGGEFREVDGTVWMHMNHGGYGYYDREADEVRYFHNDPSNPWNLSNTCMASLETNDGVVFESTSRRGLEKLEIMKSTIERRLLVDKPASTYDNEVRAMCYDARRQQLLMANKSGTLFITAKDSSRTAITHSDDGRPLGRIYGITQDSKGNFWLSSKDEGLFHAVVNPGGGLHITNFRHDDGNNMSISDNRAYQTLEDKDGNLWVATYGGGVNIMPRGTTHFLNINNVMKSYPHNAFRKVRTMAIDKDGKVWAGTTDGILIFSYNDGKVEIERLEPSEEFPDAILMSNDIVSLARDQMGTMWVGTNGGGLGHTTGKDSQGRWLFENFTSHDGLPSEEIRCITFDKRGSVWFATEHILCSFDQDKRIFTTFSTLEGVDETICSEGAAMMLPTGEILFGTVNGYYVVDRNKLISNNAAMFRLRFTAFFVNGEMQSPRLTDLYDYYVPNARQVTLPSHDASFALRFASLNYQLQHRVHYQYMLEGYDHDWINSGKDRTASYSDVPSGKYRFLVKAFLLESPDKYDVREMEITVPPMFFFSPAAIWLYMLLVAIVGISLLFMRQRQIQKGSESEKNIHSFA